MKRQREEEIKEEERLKNNFLSSSSFSLLNNKLIERKKCPFLDTINRQLLDFDMEKVCSVSLSNINIYSCLICGKFFQGRGQTTPGKLQI